MIDKRQIKDKYTRFKQWQHEPLKYANCDDVHFCNNCGLMFAGNFCPRCSQKADIGRISWKSVKYGIMVQVTAIQYLSVIAASWVLYQ